MVMNRNTMSFVITKNTDDSDIFVSLIPIQWHLVNSKSTEILSNFNQDFSMEVRNFKTEPIYAHNFPQNMPVSLTNSSPKQC